VFDIPLGVDFLRNAIDGEIVPSHVILALMGDVWAKELQHRANNCDHYCSHSANAICGFKRAFTGNRDIVRIELESALSRKVKIIPLFLRKSGMPLSPIPLTGLPSDMKPCDYLLDSMAAYGFCNGMPIRPDPDFDVDMQRLIKELEKDIRPYVSKNRPTWWHGAMPCADYRSKIIAADKIIPAAERGCLVDLPPPPAGLERKLILARDQSPLVEMIKIPAGQFTMGAAASDPHAAYYRIKNLEQPSRRIDLDEFWISRTPITNQMWHKFLRESQYQGNGHCDKDYLKHWKVHPQPPDALMDHPVVYISYINALAFCDFYGLYLPSEAQREKATRGTDARLWPWGNTPPPNPDLCNFNSSGIYTTTPVNRYVHGASPYGLLDCAGNTWEWCADQWRDNLLQMMTDTNTINISVDPQKAYSLRGGSYNDNERMMRCSARCVLINNAKTCSSVYSFRPAQDVYPSDRYECNYWWK
jgi:serine/threonine-protein kinase